MLGWAGVCGGVPIVSRLTDAIIAAVEKAVMAAVEKAMTEASRSAVNSDAILTERQVTAEYNIPTKSLQQHRYRGTGPKYLKLGKSVRYRRRDIRAWLEDNEVMPGNKEGPRRDQNGATPVGSDAACHNLAKNPPPEGVPRES